MLPNTHPVRSGLMAVPKSIRPGQPCLQSCKFFSILSGPLLDSKALYQQLQIVQHHHSIQHHRHHPPWLGISSTLTPKVLCTRSVLAFWLCPRAYGQVILAFGPARTFSIVSGPLLDSKTLCRKFRVVLHHPSFLPIY